MVLTINIIKPTDTITVRILRQLKNNCPTPFSSNDFSHMKNVPFKNTELLNRFISQVRSLADTPSLIQLIAADAGYLMVCRAIVNDSLHRKQDINRTIKTVCRIQGS